MMIQQNKGVSLWCYIWRADFQNLLHPLLHVTHLQLRSQQKSQFQHTIYWQMENVDTNWNLE